jgi:uncharacterized protein DUF3565
VKAMRARSVVSRKIVDFHLDDTGDWVAELDCGHHQSVRHNPPWSIHPWVTTPQGRLEYLGRELGCSTCDQTSGKSFEEQQAS